MVISSALALKRVDLHLSSLAVGITQTNTSIIDGQCPEVTQVLCPRRHNQNLYDYVTTPSYSSHSLLSNRSISFRCDCCPPMQQSCSSPRGQRARGRFVEPPLHRRLPTLQVTPTS
ncbi:hypothetical protein PILCRDRAFT_687338 [Piloderma croceum F 1598]|uniref:Uncharacterized protein n=1 Tax=Piloderma croceum (strain F 1598) TaxID=765440 RepID=A0A0C3ER63_PILCF|nr:hypothetical protein PILCRDRAFT_687338 [Piloderma croceum F 1598]